MQQAIAIPRRHLGRLRWNQDYVDVAMALALTGLALSTAVRDHYRLDAVSISLLILQTLPIALRRRNPMRILVITGSAITLYSLLGYLGPNGLGDSNGALGVVVAFYTVAAHEPRRRATIAAAVTAGGVLVSFAAYAAFDSISGWTANLSVTYLSFGLAWVIGDNLRVRRAYTAQLEERAVQLEHEREEKAVQAVALERARIARELHDVVAHHVSVMVVQAAGARRVIEKDPALARDALEAVEAAGRTALAEMRRMLEVLRADEAGVGPQPGLAELDRLVAQVREAGLPVELTIEGTDRELPAGMDLAAYRIVQEALTNTVKHAGRATARVKVGYERDALDIEVTDDGRGAAAPLLTGAVEGGHGLIGMHERVALYDGVLETGPVFPGGYRVHAHFPLEPAPRGSLATCCDEDSALSEVAAAAVRARRDRIGPSGHAKEPEPLVKPRVVPPLIGRVVPPHPTPRPAHRHTASTSRSNPSKTRRSEP
ncbi:MAG: sensor histidine kinase [Candidatus Limnocylindrales bacterium]|jgi:signal transduction histidine kinase